MDESSWAKGPRVQAPVAGPVPEDTWLPDGVTIAAPETAAPTAPGWEPISETPPSVVAPPPRPMPNRRLRRNLKIVTAMLVLAGGGAAFAASGGLDKLKGDDGQPTVAAVAPSQSPAASPAPTATPAVDADSERRLHDLAQSDARSRAADRLRAAKLRFIARVRAARRKQASRPATTRVVSAAPVRRRVTAQAPARSTPAPTRKPTVIKPPPRSTPAGDPAGREPPPGTP